MKKKISMLLSVISLFVTLGVVPSHAYSASVRVRATIPFEFTVDGQSFPAGDYTFEEVASRVLQIRGTDSRHVTNVTTSPVVPGGTETRAIVRFTHYGNQYYLYQVLIGGGTGIGFEARKTDMEKETARNSTVHESVDVMGKK
jgi:hypothetical protein